MAKITNTTRKLILVFCFFLSACGGGGSGGSKTVNGVETINGIVVPPDPGSAASATLAGVDANQNGVRDEVERSIASRSASQTEFNQSLALARVFQATIVKSSWTKAEALQAISNSLCAENNRVAATENTQSYDTIAQVTTNTDDRQVAFGAMLGSVGTFSSDELPGCSL